tara:strand:+ start:18616 stop:19581 length:966 start_codon:yes stop_codon:yes gene_type:complete
VRFSIILFFLFFFNLNAQKTEKIVFKSANPFALSDIITDLENQQEQEVFGKLTFPNDSFNKEEKYPLIIGVAGSLGWREHHYTYMRMFQESGFATFELNSFKSRDILSTVGSQVEVTTAAIILDAYNAFKELANHPNIDKNKVSITGWSLGGAVALFSAWKPITKAISNDLRFASHLAFYPPCFFDLENTEFTDSPIHILIGELDNWTPAKPCVNLVKKISKNSNVKLTIYDDSHHSFDSNEPVTFNEKGYSFKNCLFKLNSEGDVLMNYLNFPMSSPIMQKIGFMFCVERGVNLGGNPVSREKALLFSRSFMIKTLTDGN